MHKMAKQTWQQQVPNTRCSTSWDNMQVDLQSHCTPVDSHWNVSRMLPTDRWRCCHCARILVVGWTLKEFRFIVSVYVNLHTQFSRILLGNTCNLEKCRNSQQTTFELSYNTCVWAWMIEPSGVCLIDDRCIWMISIYRVSINCSYIE
jgi:hypothetical protein